MKTYTFKRVYDDKLVEVQAASRADAWDAINAKYPGQLEAFKLVKEE